MITITANDPDILSLMKITDQNGSIVDWSYNAFPDGQVQGKIPKIAYESSNEEISVKVSLTNPIILDLFMQLVYSTSPRKVTVNYLYGARCDKAESGDYYVCNVARKVLNDIWTATRNSSDFLAPHCFDLFADYMTTYKNFNATYDLPDCVNLNDYDCIVFPDESAYQRFKDQVIGYKYVICEKHRDQETGNIISHIIPKLPDGTKKVILLDDLADGGKSFENVAEQLSDGVKADLFIFHGVFSNNALERLLKKFNKIIVTNSLPAPEKQKVLLPEEDQDRVIIVDVWD
jgi:phosphoribosylpyrophosphate synthetase